MLTLKGVYEVDLFHYQVVLRNYDRKHGQKTNGY